LIKNTLKGKKKTKPQKTFQFIGSNGFDGERLGSAQLTLALNSRISWASRKEDNSKIDLIVTFEHPWKNNEIEVILTQIKSGFSYANIVSGKLKIKKSEFAHYKNRNHSSLICWLNQDSNEFYWFIIRANASYFRSEYNSSHKLNPSSRFDIKRILNSFNDKDGGKGLKFKTKSFDRQRDKYNFDEFKLLRKKAKESYNGLKKHDYESPLFGLIEFTRIGWRHITRESRLNEYKVASYEIIPLLKNIIIKAPSKHYIQTTLEELDNFEIYRQNEYLLEYQNIIILNKTTNSEFKTRVYIKLIEAIRYPKNWKENALLSQQVHRRVIFKSIYYKVE